MMAALPPLIGLVGYQRAGKTTIARLLADQHRYVWTRFAGPLKEMLKCLGLTDEHVDGVLKNEPCDLLGGKTPVQAMQLLGTEWGRQMIFSDLWLNVWEARVSDLLAQGYRVVVDDVRFVNESALVHSLGGELWKVNRAGISRGSDHHSEDFVSECKPTLTIQNPGDNLDELYAIVRHVLGIS